MDGKKTETFLFVEYSLCLITALTGRGGVPVRRQINQTDWNNIRGTLLVIGKLDEWSFSIHGLGERMDI